MAIPFEPNLYPNSLFDQTDVPLAIPSPDDDCRWWALYTRARQEKAVARELLGAGVHFYLPLIKKSAMYGSRRVSSYTPLFTGYVFMYGGGEQRVRALATNRLSRVLEVPDGARLWHDLRQIQHLITTGAPLTAESRLTPGTRVRVCRGAMEGIEGTIISRRGQTRLLVHVDFLQQGASVEIDDLWVEPI